MWLPEAETSMNATSLRVAEPESSNAATSAAQAQKARNAVPREKAAASRDRYMVYLLPILTGVLFFGAWEVLVRMLDISKFVLPTPSMVVRTLVTDAPVLFAALRFTAGITLAAFVLAVVSGLIFGVVLTQNRSLEMALWPYAVILQVTPAMAIAPLILIWVGLDRVWIALLLLAWVVAFFPILSNTALGLRSADHGLRNVFELYGGSRWKVFRYLLLPSALPYILAGVRISAGLSLIGAIVAEFVAGSGGATGLAWTIVEASGALNVPRMFAALFVLSAFGIAIWYATAFVQWALLHRWHESEVKQEN